MDKRSDSSISDTIQSFEFVRSSLLMFLMLSSILVLPALASEKPSPPTNTQNMPTKNLREHWDYLGVEGPRHWGMLSKEYMRCESGNPQSPINITMPHHGKHQQKLVFHYQASQLHEMNNGHTIQVSHVSGCRVDLNDRKYKLRQCHFHAPSEHHIEGKAFPMEMHLVHQDDTGHVLVIAVMMETDATQPVLSTLWKWLPEQTEHEVSIPLELSLSDILPTNTSTTPTPDHSPHRPARRACNGSCSKIPCTSPNKTLINSSTSLAKTPAPFNPSAIVTSTRIKTRSINLSYGFGWVSLFLQTIKNSCQ